MFWFNGKSLQGTCIDYKTIKVINPSGSNPQRVLQNQTKQLPISKAVPWALQVLGQGTSMGSFQPVACSKNLTLACVPGGRGRWSVSVSAGPRSRAAHRFLVSLFLSTRIKLTHVHIQMFTGQLLHAIHCSWHCANTFHTFTELTLWCLCEMNFRKQNLRVIFWYSHIKM